MGNVRESKGYRRLDKKSGWIAKTPLRIGQTYTRKRIWFSDDGLHRYTLRRRFVPNTSGTIFEQYDRFEKFLDQSFLVAEKFYKKLRIQRYSVTWSIVVWSEKYHSVRSPHEYMQIEVTSRSQETMIADIQEILADYEATKIYAAELYFSSFGYAGRPRHKLKHSNKPPPKKPKTRKRKTRVKVKTKKISRKGKAVVRGGRRMSPRLSRRTPKHKVVRGGSIRRRKIRSRKKRK